MRPHETYAILRDCDHPRLDNEHCPTVGEHDQADEDPHCHWSILTIKNGVVEAGVDWCYHTLEEAKDYIPVAEG